METIIIYTDIDLIIKFKNILEGKKEWSMIENGDLILLNGSKKVTVERIKSQDLYDDYSVPFLDIDSLNIYALHYRNIETIKFLLKIINHENTWINNDFEEKNYTYKELINKIDSDVNWDWRTKT